MNNKPLLSTLTGSNQKARIELSELFEAYADCRANKRNTMNALSFEVDYEQKLIELREEINSGVYRPGRSIAFVINHPVKREIFAADFRDRVVHHFIINKLNPLFEKGVLEIQLPRPDRLLNAARETTPWPIRQLLHNRRAGIEPLIGHTKQGGQLGRSRMKSDETTKSAGYASVFGFNLRQLTRYLAGEAHLETGNLNDIAANNAKINEKIAMDVA